MEQKYLRLWPYFFNLAPAKKGDNGLQRKKIHKYLKR
jgi:hypothetical protein